ncbi:MAG: hypothetical protein [Circular genetic element sp.]|nr:MAG: hypothetical protein [Circular genetic element sp.]
MAKKRSSRSRKLQPAPMTLTFEMGDGGTSYIDVALAASILNRRAYKQGRCWAISGMTVYAQGTNKTVRVATLQNNWVTFNAWKKGKALWDQMNDQILEVEPGVKGKYHDFKIFMDSSHLVNYVENGLQTETSVSAAKTLMPVVTNAATGGPILPEDDNLEWNYSEYVLPTDGGAVPPRITNIVMNGGTNTTTVSPDRYRVGLISGYGLSRSRPNVIDPNVPTTSGDSWMSQLFDLGAVNDDIRDIIVEENDQAPYPIVGDGSGQERYPGGETNLTGLQLVSAPITSAAGTDYSGRTSIPGFAAPCGLIYIKNDGPVTIQVHLVPGSYRGYMAPSMEDM